MQVETIDLLREESIRLLNVEIDFLQRMKAAEGVVAVDRPDEHQTFSLVSIDEDVKMLQGESSKLERLEMVLAVVGTMKAGKSTTINAIVGTEVLPNRNRPMTALPTRIRHTPGQQEPVLRLANNGPINDLMGQLQEVLSKSADQQRLAQFDSDKDITALLRQVLGGARFEREYRGPDGIFSFLKSMNDLVRLSHALDVAFPFERYASIDDIPLIEVEFAHLANLPDGIGSLTLLDTPGPNEAGQEHLRDMLREQLKNASAVLAVLDFTQLKSDADHEVRQELERIADVAQGRMYALVNKFDERDRNSDSESQTRRMVAETLLKGRLRNSDVFPVSSRLGYLANRALREIELQGRLPAISDEHTLWVEDFGRAALGPRWQKSINDPQEVHEAATILWEESKFSHPLEHVIGKAHTQAAGMAISAAAAKLVDVAVRLRNFLNVREVALGKDAGELESQIDSLRRDVERIAELESRSQGQAKKALVDISEEIKGVFAIIRSDIGEKIEDGFKKGKETEEKQLAQAAGVPSLFGLLARTLKQAHTTAKGRYGREFDEKNPIIKLNSKADAEEVVDGIEKGVLEIISHNESRLGDETDRILKRFHKRFENDICRQASQLIGELNGRFNGSGFSIDIRMPATPALSLKQGRGEFLRSVIESKQRSVPKRRRSTGVWGSICGFFGTEDWGWESYTATERYFEVDINKIKWSISTSINKMFAALENAVVDTIEAPLEQSVKCFFIQLKLGVESLRSDLAQSIRDKETSQEQQHALATTLAEFKRVIPSLLHDTQALQDDMPLSAYQGAV